VDCAIVKTERKTTNKGVTMEQIALELKRLNATMADILYLIQKEMKKSEEYAKSLKEKYDKE